MKTIEGRQTKMIDGPAELESQFILRLPEEPARILREAINNNSTLKDRFAIKVENDLRHGEIRVDHHLLNAKVVDLPTIIESVKTIDGKSFYKTADICQMLVCKDGDDQTTDEESQQKTKRKDSIKVDKKYLWPHGITPPTKNVRKRRFRKTLRKKYAEAPEIEKEVKRLIRSDNEAVGIKWEVINEEDDNRVNKGTVVIKKEPLDTNSQNVAEHDIFGSALSDSEEEDAHLNVLDMDENSGDSHLTDSSSMMNVSNDNKLLTEFSSKMFLGMQNTHVLDYYHSQPSVTYSSKPLSKGAIEQRLDELDMDLAELKIRRQQQELKIDTIENIALRQRFQDALDGILQEQLDKEQEQYDLQELLKQTE